MLTVGFFGLSIGTLLAYQNPATGYELSLYHATPNAYWLGVGAAFGCSFVVALRPPSPSLRFTALGLAGTATVTIVALPLVRGYAFIGRGDALSHLGWVRDVSTGELGVLDLLYPGLHAITVLVEPITGASPERSLSLVVVAFALVFVVFVPVTIGLIVDSARVRAIGLFSAAMFLPINNVSAHLVAHPSTLAILFLPLILALVVAYLREPRSGVSSIGGLLAVCSVSIVLLHPQQAANVLVFLMTIAGVQFLRQRKSGWDPTFRPLYGQTAILALAFGLWSSQHDRVANSAELLVTLLLFEAEAADAVQQRGTSLAEIGASLEEVFVKLFLVSTIYIAVAGLVMLRSLRQYEDRSPRTELVRYMTLGLVPIGGLFVLYLVAGGQTMYFRYLAFLMAVVTVIGSLGIADGVTAIKARSRSVAGVATIGIVVMLVLSMLVLFPSPYVYQPNTHVSEQQFSGYETAFETRSDGIEYVSIRGGPTRFEHAVEGTGELLGLAAVDVAVPGDALDEDIRAHYDGQRYVVVTQADRQRESQLYSNLRYSERGINGMDHQPGLHRVQSNGGFDLYLLDAETTVEEEIETVA